MILTGALVNGGAIVVGGLLGTFGGKLMPEKMRQTVLGATALVSMGIGISGAIGSSNQLIPILSLVIGAVIGELLHIEDGVTRAGDWLQKKFGKMGPITDGFVSGSLVFAVGAMAVMGSLDSGLKNDHGILLAKSVIDFAGSVAFASSMGIGIVFSGLSVLAVEGVMTLLASLLTGVLTDAVITEISVTGSLMIIGITLNVLGVTKLRILNMTPALLLPFCCANSCERFNQEEYIAWLLKAIHRRHWTFCGAFGSTTNAPGFWRISRTMRHISWPPPVRWASRCMKPCTRHSPRSHFC